MRRHLNTTTSVTSHYYATSECFDFGHGGPYEYTVWSLLFSSSKINLARTVTVRTSKSLDWSDDVLEGARRPRGAELFNDHKLPVESFSVDRQTHAHHAERQACVRKACVFGKSVNRGSNREIIEIALSSECPLTLSN